MLEPFVAYPCRNILAVQLRETCERGEQTSDGREYSIGDLLTLLRALVGKGELQVAERCQAQARDCAVEDPGVEARKRLGRVAQGPQNKTGDYVLDVFSLSVRLRRVGAGVSMSVPPSKMREIFCCRQPKI